MSDRVRAIGTLETPTREVSTGRRDFILGVANGTLARLGMALFDPSLVVAAFVYEQSGSAFLVGLVGSLRIAGLIWPQMYLSSLMEHRPRKKPFYVFSSAARILLLLAMAAVVFLSGRVDGVWPLGLFFVLFFLYTSMQGCSMLSFWHIVGQSIPVTARGGFLGYRGLIGGALAFFGGLLVAQPIVDGLPSPGNYALLILLAVVAFGAAWSLFGLVREVELPELPAPRRFRDVLASGVRALKRDANYRLLLLLRVLFRFNRLAVVFYVPYGVNRLGAARLSGIFVGGLALSQLASSLLWGKMGDRRGNRRCLLWAGVLFVLSPLAALAAPRMPGLFACPLPFTDVILDLRLSLYLLALFLFGVGQQASIIGFNAFVLAVAPAHRRPSYLGFLNTVTLPFTLLPVVAGALVGTAAGRLDILFAVIVVAGLGYLATSRALTEVREPAS